MKHCLLVSLFLSMTLTCLSQGISKKSDRLWWEVREIAYNTYAGKIWRLYPTRNPQRFLRLNTGTGQIDQIEWSLDLSEETITPLNDKPLREKKKYAIDHHVFELYATVNEYTFILFNTETGETWHVQWSENEEECFVKQIISSP